MQNKMSFSKPHSQKHIETGCSEMNNKEKERKINQTCEQHEWLPTMAYDRNIPV